MTYITLNTEHTFFRGIFSIPATSIRAECVIMPCLTSLCMHTCVSHVTRAGCTLALHTCVTRCTSHCHTYACTSYASYACAVHDTLHKYTASSRAIGEGYVSLEYSSGILAKAPVQTLPSLNMNEPHFHTHVSRRRATLPVEFVACHHAAKAARR